MSGWGWFILGLVGVLIWNIKDFSILKRIIGIAVTYFICALIFGGGSEDDLKEAGGKYILQNINSPSTAEFISYVNSKDTKEALEDMGVKLESKHDVVVIEVEATNALGGRIKKSYAVFFVNKKPVEMIDADNLNPQNVRQAISYLRENKGW